MSVLICLGPEAASLCARASSCASLPLWHQVLILDVQAHLLQSLEDQAGRRKANGDRFDPQAMTCAHRTLPLGSMVKVTAIATGKNVALEVNDRGPYVKGRIVDLSEGAARELGIGDNGVTVVRLEVISQPVQPG